MEDSGLRPVYSTYTRRYIYSIYIYYTREREQEGHRGTRKSKGGFVRRKAVGASEDYVSVHSQ